MYTEVNYKIRVEVARLRKSAQVKEIPSGNAYDWMLQGRAEMARETADRLQEILDLDDGSQSVERDAVMEVCIKCGYQDEASEMRPADRRTLFGDLIDDSKWLCSDCDGDIEGE